MSSTKYIGMDVHKESISIAVMNSIGKIVMECVIETKASMILQLIDGLRGDLQVTFEELAELLRLHHLTPVYHGGHRHHGCLRVYARCHRAEWLDKITEPGVHRRAEFYYQQLDALRLLRHEVRRDLLTESKKHKVWKRLCQIPSIGPIRAAALLGILQTPHRFRNKRQLWNYGGLAIETHSSADHRSVDGQLQRAKKQVLVRGLNRNCNHDLKNLFKGAAAMASSKPGPFERFYAALVAKGMKPEMARLTLARKIATVVLIVWKKGVCFDAQYLNPQTA